jgi:hypothetical protein
MRTYRLVVFSKSTPTSASPEQTSSICLVGASMLAAAVVALAAHNTYIFQKEYQTYYSSFAPVALAAGGLTLLTLPTL